MSQNQLPPAIAEIIKQIPPEFMASNKAENAAVVSARSIRFDIPDGKDGINRVKITKDGQSFMVRFYRVVEVEMLYDVPGENLMRSISAVTGMKIPS